MATDHREIVIAEMKKQTALLERILVAVSGQQTSSQSAPRVDLDGQHGDPIVKSKSPRNWTGDNMTGRRFSECPPEYLDQVADRLEHFAAGHEATPNDAEAAKKARFERLDAQRARGWAARLRAGYAPPVAPQRVNENEGEPRW